MGERVGNGKMHDLAFVNHEQNCSMGETVELKNGTNRHRLNSLTNSISEALVYNQFLLSSSLTTVGKPV